MCRMALSPREIILEAGADVPGTEPPVDHDSANTSAAWQLWYLRMEMREYARALVDALDR